MDILAKTKDQTNQTKNFKEMDKHTLPARKKKKKS